MQTRRDVMKSSDRRCAGIGVFPMKSSDRRCAGIGVFPMKLSDRRCAGIGVFLMKLSDRRCAARTLAASLNLLRKLAVAEIHRVTLRPSDVKQCASVLHG